MKKALLVTVLLLSLLGGSGCQSVKTYVKDRGYDFMDMTGIKVCAGKGFRVGFDMGYGVISPVYEMFGLDLERIVTPPGIMFGYHDLFKFGYQGRAVGVWRDRGVEILATIDRNLKADTGNTFLFESVDEFNDIYKSAPERAVAVPLDYPQYRYHYSFDLQLALVAFFGFEIDLSFFQATDFFLGIFGLDIALDDARNRFYQEEEDIYDVRPTTGGSFTYP